jgi:dTDP-4-amino-4,6-dideoxygalactose transaminase
VIPDNYNHVFHLYVIQVSQRNELQKELKDKGIQTQIHYPAPVTSTRPYSDRGQFPVSDKITGRILSIPMYAELDAEKVSRVSEVINSFLNKQ